MDIPANDLTLLTLLTGLDKWRGYSAALPQGQFRILEDFLRLMGKEPRHLLEDASLLEFAPLKPGMRRRAYRALERAESVRMEMGVYHSMGVRYLTEFHEEYPARLRLLAAEAPPVLFAFGDIALLQKRGIALAGQRRARSSIRKAAWRIGALCAEEGLPLFSGGAQGADCSAEVENLAHGGENITILSEGFLHSRGRALGRRRMPVDQGRQLLLCAYHPLARFAAHIALWRNHMIYALGDAVVTLAAGDGTGGSYAGTVANLRGGWSPQYVLDGPSCPPGNGRLIGLGARPLAIEDIYREGFSLRKLIE